MASPFRKDIVAGKVVVITGGATGIGFGIAKVLGEHGAKVGIISRRKEVIDTAVAQLKEANIQATGCAGDVRDAESVRRAMESIVAQLGSIDILVNNAAGNFMCAAEELTPNGFKTVNEIDLQGTFNSSLSALPYLKRSGGNVNGNVNGSLIINISATLSYKAMPFQVHAASAKAGVDVLTNTLGIEWGHYGIRVVGIAPGPIRGTVGGPEGRVFGMGKEALKGMDIGPLRRFGEVEDIAYTALFLCTPAASYITATTLVVDGGHWHQSYNSYALMKDLVSRKKDAEKSTRPKL